MPYHIRIHDKYWPLKFKDWNRKTSEEQIHCMQEEIKAIRSLFLAGATKDTITSGVRRSVLDNEEIDLVTIQRFDPLLPSLELIATEREEQLRKHGLDAAHDDDLVNCELLSLANAVLSNSMDSLPDPIHVTFFNRIVHKDRVEQLVVTAALISAEIDRLLRARDAVPAKPKEPAPGDALTISNDLWKHAINAGLSVAETERLMTHVGQRAVIRQLLTNPNTTPWVGVQIAAQPHVILRIPLASCIFIQPPTEDPNP